MLSQKEISENGCAELDRLAKQVEELYLKGVDICSQNTFYAEDFDDIDLIDDTQEAAATLNNELQKNSNENDNDGDAYFDFSSEDEGTDRCNRKKEERRG